MHIHIKYIYIHNMHRRTDARASPYAARSTHGYTDTHTQDSGDDRPRKSFPLRSTVDARKHIAGFRRRPATQESPLTQHGRRTDTHVIVCRIPATTGHVRASPYAARSTYGYTDTHTHRIPATTGHARASPYAAQSTHGDTSQDSGDDRPRKSLP